MALKINLFLFLLAGISCSTIIKSVEHRAGLHDIQLGTPITQRTVSSRSLSSDRATQYEALAGDEHFVPVTHPSLLRRCGRACGRAIDRLPEAFLPIALLATTAYVGGFLTGIYLPQTNPNQMDKLTSCPSMDTYCLDLIQTCLARK